MSDELLTCPYNQSHQIQPHRMQLHLVKCGKQYPNINLNRCPFNRNHLLRDADFAQHKLNCNDRHQLEQLQQQLAVSQTTSNENNVPNAYRPPIEEESTGGDSWGDEDSRQLHTEKVSAMERAIVRSNVGLSKAKKKEFREKERERIQKVQDRQKLGNSKLN